MRRSGLASGRLGRAALCALGGFGCAKFAPPSELHGVRVLGVHQDPASGSPGASVDLEILVADERSATTAANGDRLEPPPVEVRWIAGCNNPPSRQYYACSPILRALAENPNADTARLLGSGTKFSVRLPEDVLSAAPLLPTDPLHYGVSYVFFAVCGGHVVMDGRDGFLFGCVDAAGAAVDPRNFVIGFTTIYSYEGDENQNTNPTLDGVDFDGASALPWSPFADADGQPLAPRTCAKETEDADCAGAALSHPAVCSDNGVCAPLVAACQGKKCPKYAVLPRVSPGSFETFTGENEIMWASFYATLGSFDFDTRLADDRVNGPTRDVSSGWQAPAPDGSGLRRTSTIWVTLNDQRGGATWASFDVVVE